MNLKISPLSLALLFAFGVTVQAGRLGDLPDENTKQQKAKAKTAPEDDIYSPEERKQVTTKLADEYYGKGLAAFREEQLGQAKKYFEKVLALSPNHGRAKEKLASINKTLASEKKAKAPPPPPPAKLVIPEAKPIKRVVEKTVSPEQANKKVAENKEMAAELYFQALLASQDKNRMKAVDLCRQALRLDPSNLQAQRMMDRLSQSGY